MLIKAGVDISRLTRQTRRALRLVSDYFFEHGEECVVTSTYEGNHSAGSLHYSNEAFDTRLPASKSETFLHDLKSRLGKNYDVVIETFHIHIEYDPK